MAFIRTVPPSDAERPVRTPLSLSVGQPRSDNDA